MGKTEISLLLFLPPHPHVQRSPEAPVSVGPWILGTSLERQENTTAFSAHKLKGETSVIPVLSRSITATRNTKCRPHTGLCRTLSFLTESLSA